MCHGDKVVPDLGGEVQISRRGSRNERIPFKRIILNENPDIHLSIIPGFIVEGTWGRWLVGWLAYINMRRYIWEGGRVWYSWPEVRKKGDRSVILGLIIFMLVFCIGNNFWEPWLILILDCWEPKLYPILSRQVPSASSTQYKELAQFILWMRWTLACCGTIFVPTKITCTALSSWIIQDKYDEGGMLWGDAYKCVHT